MSKQYAIAITDTWPIATGDHVEIKAVTKSDGIHLWKLDDNEILKFTEQEFNDSFIPCPNDSREARNHVIKDFPNIIEQDLKEFITTLRPSTQRHFLSSTRFDKEANAIIASNGLAVFWSTENIQVGATSRYLATRKS